MVPIVPKQPMDKAAIPVTTTAQSKKKPSLDCFIIGRPFMVTGELMSFHDTFTLIGRDDWNDGIMLDICPEGIIPD
jgi:hypothetical protein